MIGNALASVQVGSKLALSTSQWLLACTPVLPTWISMLSVCTYIYWIAHRTEGRDIHRGTCGLYLFVTQYIVYPIKRVHLLTPDLSLLCSTRSFYGAPIWAKVSTPRNVFEVLFFNQLSLRRVMLASVSWNVHVLFNFTLSLPLKRWLKSALHNVGN